MWATCLRFCRNCRRRCDCRSNTLKLSAAHLRRCSSCRNRQKRLPYVVEQPWRQHSICGAAVTFARNRAQVRTRPQEFIPLRQRNPRRGVIQTEAPLDRSWNLDGIAGSHRRAVRHWQHKRARLAVFLTSYGRDHRARPVFEPLFEALNVLPAP